MEVLWFNFFLYITAHGNHSMLMMVLLAFSSSVKHIQHILAEKIIADERGSPIISEGD